MAEAERPHFSGHFGRAPSKPPVHLTTTGSRELGYKISCYAPKDCVKVHADKLQGQVYHGLEGEALMVIAGERRVARRHDFVSASPGVEHGVASSAAPELVSIAATAVSRAARWR